MTSEPSARAHEFRRLHADGVLLLANCWDAGSARLIESLGAKALATTSAGVAWSHGYADGDLLPVPLLVATVRDIARVVRVPLTVDVEGGYSTDPATVGEVVRQVVEAGGVGINLEDGTGAPDLLCAKIEQAKRAGAQRGVDLFVNARTDVYLSNLAPPERRVDESLERSARYRAAGADGIFVPGVTDPVEIEAIAAAAKLPLNVLVRPGLPPLARLAQLGVRRLSTGSWVASALLGRARTLVGAFLGSGIGDPLYEGALPYAEVNALLGRR
jgi:2-methylisocitrate lyase-like PEP mutase family enzyme